MSLDAIDLCPGARGNSRFTDADFFGMDVSKPVSINADAATVSRLTRQPSEPLRSHVPRVPPASEMVLSASSLWRSR